MRVVQLLKKAILLLTFGCLSLLTINLWAAPLSSQMCKLLNSQGSAAGIASISVANYSSGSIIYSYNSNRRFVPASNLKLFTAASALFAFGKNYHFNTTISANTNHLVKGVLNDNLYINFVGDPSLTVDDLKRLLLALKNKGIRRINGDVIVNGSRFSPPNYAPGWTENSINWYYSAPITAVALNENAFSMTLLATSHIGVKTKAKIYRYSRYISLSNDLLSASQQQANHNCSLVMTMNEANHLSLSGCWPARKDDSLLRVAIKNPSLFAEGVIKDTLASNGIIVAGKIRSAKAPNGLTVIASHQSAPLSSLMKTMLKRSDNFYAGCLIKALGSKYYKIGNFQNGVLAEKKILSKQANVNFAHMRIVDGSGQSYFDHVQVRQIVRLLYRVRKSAIGNIYYQSLPISGVDGTLAYRMSGIRSKVHAKTGSMQAGNYSLSGYIKTANDKTLVFSMIVNNAASATQARALLDKAANILYRYHA